MPFPAIPAIITAVAGFMGRSAMAGMARKAVSGVARRSAISPGRRIMRSAVRRTFQANRASSSRQRTSIIRNATTGRMDNSQSNAVRNFFARQQRAADASGRMSHVAENRTAITNSSISNIVNNFNNSETNNTVEPGPSDRRQGGGDGRMSYAERFADNAITGTERGADAAMRGNTFTQRLLASQQDLIKFNGNIAAGFARLQSGRINRQVEAGELTGGSTRMLAESMNRLEESIAPFKNTATFLLNMVGTAGLEAATISINTLSEVIKLQFPMLAKMVEEKAAELKKQAEASEVVPGKGRAPMILADMYRMVDKIEKQNAKPAPNVAKNPRKGH